MRWFLQLLVILNAGTFLLFALSHAGISIPLGFALLAEPRIIPATIVEGLCSSFFAVSAYAVLTHRGWAWPITTAAHLFSLGGVLLGMAALAAGRGPRTETNDLYHRVMLGVLSAGLILLLTVLRRERFAR